MKAEDKILKARMNIITDYGFFAQLLLSCDIIENHTFCPTLCTNGDNIYYNEKFVNTLSLGELSFVLLHEVMHCALGHLWRRDNREPKMWNIATDYAVNALINNIGDSYYEENVNRMGNNANLCLKLVMPKECLYDEQFNNMAAEDIYNILSKNQKKINITVSSSSNGNGDDDNQSGNGNGNSNNQSNNSKKGKNGNGGFKLTKNADGSYSGTIQAPDNHETWDEADKKSAEEKQNIAGEWEDKLLSAHETAKNHGIGSAALERIINKITKPQKDWRQLLQEFIQEEVNDYSWMPPDRRYDGDFFMCDFNDTTEIVKDVLFFVDTSGSMGSEEINACFSEIQGAIDQFKKNLHGKLFFFDYDVQKEYYDFDEVQGDVSKLAAFGGGGTSYDCIFQYIKDHENDFNEINGVIILTDGYCSYPEQEPPFPILWVYTNEDGYRETAPYGKHTTIKVEE